MRASRSAHVGRRGVVAGLVAALSVLLTLGSSWLPAGTAQAVNPNVNVRLTKLVASDTNGVADPNPTIYEQSKARLEFEWEATGSPSQGDGFTISLPEPFYFIETTPVPLMWNDIQAGTCTRTNKEMTCEFGPEVNGKVNVRGAGFVVLLANATSTNTSSDFTVNGVIQNVAHPDNKPIEPRPVQPWYPVGFAKWNEDLTGASTKIQWNLEFSGQDALEAIAASGTPNSIVLNDVLSPGHTFIPGQPGKFELIGMSKQGDSTLNWQTIATGDGVVNGNWGSYTIIPQLSDGNRKAAVTINGPFEASMNYMLRYYTQPTTATGTVQKGFVYENNISLAGTAKNYVDTAFFASSAEVTVQMEDGSGSFKIRKALAGEAATNVDPDNTEFTVKAAWTLPDGKTADQFPAFTLPANNPQTITLKAGEAFKGYKFPTGTVITLTEDDPALAGNLGIEKKSFVVDGAPAAENTTTFTIENLKATEVVLTNTIGNTAPQTGKFSITKSLVANGAAAPASFTFSYVCGTDPAVTATVTPGNTWESPEIPAGTTCTITEDSAAAQVAGWTLVPTLDTNQVTIQAGQTTPVNATNTYTKNPDPKVSVGDFVWEDTDQNGVQDAGEPGIKDVSVTISRTDGAPVTLFDGGAATTTVTTGPDGKYSFDNLAALPPNTHYTVTVTDPAGYQPTVTTGPDRATNSSTGSAESTDLVNEGDKDDTLDFGYIRSVPAIEVEKFSTDLGTGDADTAGEAVELGAAAEQPVTITVTNNGNEDLNKLTFVDTATDGPALKDLKCTIGGREFPSDGNGTVTIDPTVTLARGASYTCTATLPALGAGKTHADTVRVGGTGIGSGVPVNDEDPWHAKTPAAKVSVGDFVWEDLDRNGVQDGGEPGIKDVTLTITRTDGMPVTTADGSPATATTTSGPDGKYSFTNLATLPAGQKYIVTVTGPAGYQPTVDTGADRATNSSTGNATANELPNDGDKDDTLDFGFIKSVPSISVEKFSTDLATGDADTAGDAVVLGAQVEQPVSITVTNNGNEELNKLTFTDTATDGPALKDLACVVGGRTFQADAAGVVTIDPALTLAVGDSYQCTATLPVLGGGKTHADTVRVGGTGVGSGTPAEDEDPWHAKTNPAKVSVGDFVWEDLNKDGIQDGGEPGIQDVTLTLGRSDNQTPKLSDGTNATLTTKTGPDGKYSFDNLEALPAGTRYTVAVTDPAGYQPTLDTGADRETNSSTGVVGSTDLENDGDRDASLDFGFVKSEPAISVEKFSTDLATGDADRRPDLVLVDGKAEQPVTMTVTNNGNEELTALTFTDTTTEGPALKDLKCVVGGREFTADATGLVTIDPALSLAPGDSYTCTATLPALGADKIHADTVRVGGTGIGSGIPVEDEDPWHAASPPGKVSVGDFVWEDTDNDGIQDAGEPGIKDVTLVIGRTDGVPILTEDDNRPIILTTTTDADGKYSFDNLATLPAGTHYIVTVQNPDGFIPTKALEGNDDALDSSTGAVESKDLVNDGESDPTLDFGFVKAAPAINVEKFSTDVATGDADTAQSAVTIGPDAEQTVTITVENTGNDELNKLTFTDTATDGPALKDLLCTLNGQNYPADDKGVVTFDPAITLPVGGSYTCVATLPVLGHGKTHADTVRVGGTGIGSGTPVDDEDPWHSQTPPARVSVGDFVWIDTDKDGVQDADEPGIKDVTLTITRTDGAPVTLSDGKPATVTTTTDDKGLYSFDNLAVLPAGVHYVVSVTNPAGYVPTVDTGADRETNSSTGLAESTDLTNDAQRDASLDFGFVEATPTISVEKYSTNVATGDADSAQSAVVIPAKTEQKVSFDVTNTGDEELTELTFKDVAGDGPALKDLKCVVNGREFAADDAGVVTIDPAIKLAVGASYSCTAVLPELAPDTTHSDTAQVGGKGVGSGKPVEGEDPWNAKGVPGKVSVGDFVWFDSDEDGVQEDDEPGIQGVVLKVTGPNGAPVKDVDGKDVGEVTTDQDGKYSFENLPTLPAGQHYTVTIAKLPKDTYLPTKAGATDSDKDSSTGSAESADLTTDGNSDPTLDFGFIASKPNVEVEKFSSTDTAGDADSAQSAVHVEGPTSVSFTVGNYGNEDLTKMTFVDSRIDGVAMTDLKCTVEGKDYPADDQGVVTIDPNYVLKVGQTFRCVGTLPAIPVGDTHADKATVTGLGASSGTPVKGEDPWHARHTPKVSVGDWVWLDANNNGLQDADEKGIEGVRLGLTKSDGTPATTVDGKPVAETVTDKDGYYSFTDLPEGSYTVTILGTPEGYAPTTPGIGADREFDSSTDSVTSRTLKGDGDKDLSLDFGFVLVTKPPVTPPTPPTPDTPPSVPPTPNTPPNTPPTENKPETKLAITGAATITMLATAAAATAIGGVALAARRRRDG
ncbi:MAG: SdrD B-like domain-containing protein [Actinomycetaceae bacterium]|nr:SdrD B-like domain-containing protein [Actinomycetaceae bacterium]